MENNSNGKPLEWYFSPRGDPEYTYSKAQAQQEPGGRTWCVATDVIKYTSGEVTRSVFEPNLPHKQRATRLAKILNRALS